MPSAPRGYQVDDLYWVRSVSDPQVSPNGRQVAYVVGAIDTEADGYKAAIWVVNRDGSGARQVTGGVKNDGQPRWSPDGRHLAFVSNRNGGAAQLYVLPLDGGEARRLTDVKGGVLEIAWAPDGSAIAFTARAGVPEEKQGTPRPRVITSLKHKFNGQGFFDGSRRHVFVVDVAAGEPRQLTEGDFDDGQIAWSPDGREIAFVSARHESRERDMAQDLWAVSAKGGGPRRLTERFGPINAPDYSPDGQSIAFVGHTDSTDVGGRTAYLWLIPAAGGTARNLTVALDRSIQAGPLNPGAPPARFSWTADGASLIARAQDGAAVQLCRIAAADGSVSVLAGGRRVVESFSLAGDGTIACAINDPTHPAEVYLVGADGTEWRLTSVNDALLAELRFPAWEDVRVTMPDGGVVEGWVIKPLDMEPGRKYPLVLDVHGGPHGAFLYSFRGSYPVALAVQGCAVVQMNPRGSTGWGEDFARSLHGGRGERDLPELLAAVDEVIARGWVDPERLGITGYSYGGYMTAWAISQTDRFKAAVWGAGTANLYTHFAYSDINVPRYQEMKGSPWERRELYLQQSPISHVQNVKTPLLMLHGEADLRCNIAQADEFFTALRYFGVEAMLVRYPGEHHGMRLQGKPSNRLDYDQRLIAWFAERLSFGSAVAREQLVAAEPS